MGLVIDSDFKDYYDICAEEHGILYERKYSMSKSRAKELNELRKLGIETIELRQLSQFMPSNKSFVIYTDPYKHMNKGKKLMKYSDAIQMYGNYLASEYIHEKSDITMKYIQVGTRRFRVYYKTDNGSILNGKVVKIEEADRSKNIYIKAPIFSIDYIFVGSRMLAVDFNEVQKLEGIGIEDLMTPEQVCMEIEDTLERNCLIKVRR